MRPSVYVMKRKAKEPFSSTLGNKKSRIRIRVFELLQ
jgi:hypothetical protein